KRVECVGGQPKAARERAERPLGRTTGVLRFRSSSDCTFGCILLRIKFCMHPVNYTLHVSAPTVWDSIRLLRAHPAVLPSSVASLHRTNQTKLTSVRSVRCARTNNRRCSVLFGVTGSMINKEPR